MVPLEESRHIAESHSVRVGHERRMDSHGSSTYVRTVEHEPTRSARAVGLDEKKVPPPVKVHKTLSDSPESSHSKHPALKAGAARECDGSGEKCSSADDSRFQGRQGRFDVPASSRLLHRQSDTWCSSEVESLPQGIASRACLDSSSQNRASRGFSSRRTWRVHYRCVGMLWQLVELCHVV